MVRERVKRAGHIHPDTSSGNKDFTRGGTLKFGHVVLQGRGEVGACCGQQLQDAEGASDSAQLLSAVDATVALHLRGPRLEGLLLVEFAGQGGRGGATAGTFTSKCHLRKEKHYIFYRMIFINFVYFIAGFAVLPGLYGDLVQEIRTSEF